MRQDMNFFIEFNGKKKRSDSSTIILGAFVGVILIFIVGTLLYNTSMIIYNNKKAEQYRDMLKTPEMVAKIKESNEVNDKIDALTQYDRGITEIIDAVESREVVDSTLLNQLSSTIPSEVSFNNINISSSEITISATSTSRTAIAEIQHNLKELKNVYDVKVGSISGENNFTFDITINLKAVD